MSAEKSDESGLRTRADSEPGTGRLILVSNRLPCTLKQSESGGWISTPSAGGLATGLSKPHRDTGGRWVGWPGIKTETGDLPLEVNEMLSEQGFVGVGLSHTEYDHFYIKFANSCIWPLFHYFTEKVAFTAEDWAVYQTVNRKFADAVLAVVEDDDYVFVQDYHFMLLPAMLREARPRLRIGFFLHIPFPSSEIFRIFPKRKDLLLGMLGADVIGFHTLDYVRHFRTTLRRVMGLDFAGNAFDHDNRSVRLMAEPLGIDPDVWQVKETDDEEVMAEIQSLREAIKGRKLILGVERLDYSKGIPERLAAFRDLLTDDPSLADKLMFIQITVPSRIDADDYKDLKSEIDRLAGEINGTFGKPGLQPLHYQFRGVNRKALLAMYRLADVALVTPLRDGLNLVAKEFVASKIDNTGALVLGEFAGVAWELGEAIKVNPYDPDALKKSIATALAMEPAEQARRMKSMRKRVLNNSIFTWADRMLSSIQVACYRAKPKLVAGTILEAMLNRWQDSEEAFLFLDYDGSLREFEISPGDATPTPDILEILRNLVSVKKCQTWIVSGRDSTFMGKYLGQIEGLGLIAEHGASIRGVDCSEFELAAEMPSGKWREEILEIFGQFVERVPKSTIEEKPIGLAWHYRGSDPSIGVWQARELFDHLQDVLPPGLEVMRGNHVLEVRPTGVSKAHAVHTVLAKHSKLKGEARFVLAVGDDVTDESMFRAFPSDRDALTILVGKRASAARYRVQEPEDLRSHLRLLFQLARARVASAPASD